MELLLLLAALFASLTGSGDGARARGTTGVTVIQAAQAAKAAVQPASTAAVTGLPPGPLRPVRALGVPRDDAPLRSVRLTFERRLE